MISRSSALKRAGINHSFNAPIVRQDSVFDEARGIGGASRATFAQGQQQADDGLPLRPLREVAFDKPKKASIAVARFGFVRRLKAV